MEPLVIIDVWQWWVFGVLLILAEAIVPQAFLMWIGLSAVFTGSFVALKPEIGTVTTIVLFILTSGIVSSIAARLGYSKEKIKNAKKSANKKKQLPLKKVVQQKGSSAAATNKTVTIKKINTAKKGRKSAKTNKKNPRKS